MSKHYAIHLCINPSVVIEHAGEKYEIELTYMGPEPLDSKGNPRGPDSFCRLPKPVQAQAVSAWRAKYPRKP